MYTDKYLNDSATTFFLTSKSNISLRKPACQSLAYQISKFPMKTHGKLHVMQEVLKCPLLIGERRKEKQSNGWGWGWKTEGKFVKLFQAFVWMIGLYLRGQRGTSPIKTT